LSFPSPTHPQQSPPRPIIILPSPDYPIPNTLATPSLPNPAIIDPNIVHPESTTQPHITPDDHSTTIPQTFNLADLLPQISNLSSDIEQFVDAPFNLPAFNGASRPSSSTHSDNGTSLAIQVFNHISGSLPQWIAVDPNMLASSNTGEISIRTLRASARQKGGFRPAQPQT